mgnify:CR=1 FL=1|tara:strand:+ start:950 stop:1468 length:519 start_codon:yes stop_codon:yes gene_type:complete
MPPKEKKDPIYKPYSSIEDSAQRKQNYETNYMLYFPGWSKDDKNKPYWNNKHNWVGINFENMKPFYRIDKPKFKEYFKGQESGWIDDKSDPNIIKALGNAGWKSPDEFFEHNKKLTTKYDNLSFNSLKEITSLKDKNQMLTTWKITLIITSSVLFIALLISLFMKGKKGKNK